MTAQQGGLMCPRCRSLGCQTLAESPVPGIWTVYGCPVCFYAWRSTEPAQNQDPAQYPEAFRLKPDELNNFPVVPTIPPLRQK
jgi:vanillate/4-hydroxybenzoate decarboxylase subunit D